MEAKKISVEKDGYVLLIGLDRADKRNALDLDMYWQLAAAYGELHNNLICAAGCSLRTAIISPRVWTWCNGLPFLLKASLLISLKA